MANNTMNEGIRATESSEITLKHQTQFQGHTVLLGKAADR